VDERGHHASAATAARYFAALRAMLNATADDANLTGRSPDPKVALSRIVRSERRTLTPGDLRRLVDELPGHYQTLVLTAGVPGVAWEEAVALRIRDV